MLQPHPADQPLEPQGHRNAWASYPCWSRISQVSYRDMQWLDCGVKMDQWLELQREEMKRVGKVEHYLRLNAAFRSFFVS